MLIDEAAAQTDYFASRKKKVTFSMAIGNGELMHECFPKHSRRNNYYRPSELYFIFYNVLK